MTSRDRRGRFFMARKLIVTENVTVDSVIDADGGWFVPSGAEDPAGIEEMRQVEEELRATADALLIGRQTFEEFRGYWPLQTDDTGVAGYINAVQKYVVSATFEDPGWEPTTILRGDLAEEVSALKAADGGDIVVTGSVSLVHSLNRTDLVDEYRLFVYPTVMGEGRTLFAEAPTARAAADRHARLQLWR
jgi:dihydrofolate reductase